MMAKWNRAGTWAVGQAYQPDSRIVRLESLTYMSVGFHLASIPETSLLQSV